MRARQDVTNELTPAAPTRSAWWFDRVVLGSVAFAPLLGVLWAIHLAWDRGGIGGVNLGLFAFFWAATMFGIEGGYHRYFSHRAFRTGRVFEAMLVIFGSMAFQGPAVWWAALHRRHHKHADRPGDPHSPHLGGTGVRSMLAGLWDAHMGWNIREFETIRDKSTWKHLVPDLLGNRWLRAVNRGYFLWLALGLVLPAALGALLTWSWRGAFEGFLWGGLVRMFAVTHGIYLVNSVGHAFGSRPFALHARDRATNNTFVAVVTLGAGLHHNHHLFPASATNRVTPWQFDVTGAVLGVLASLGIVRDLHRPPADANSSRWNRRVTARLGGAHADGRGTLAGLTANGAFVESRRVKRLVVGARVRLQSFQVFEPAGGSHRIEAAPAIPDVDAIVEYASWQGVGVRFVDQTEAFKLAVERLCRRGPDREIAASPPILDARPDRSGSPIRTGPSEPPLTSMALTSAVVSVVAHSPQGSDESSSNG